MNSRELHRFGVAEYPSVIHRAMAGGWLAPLMEAHAVECGMSEAAKVLAYLRIYQGLPDLRLQWRSRRFRGRAGFDPRKGYRISLPTVTGSRSCLLRVGLVLHEAAHVLDHQRRRARQVGRHARTPFGHGPDLCNTLRDLLRQAPAADPTVWRASMPTSSFREIYDRHRGPYSLHLVRELTNGKGKATQSSDNLAGPFSAEEAHEEARLLVKSAKDDVVEVFVFSVTEGQFIGAFYKRGEEHRPWHELEENRERGVELPDATNTTSPTPSNHEQATLLPGGPEPVREVDAPVERRVPKRTLPRDRPVRDVPAERAAAPRTPPAPRKRAALELDHGNAERWPKSEGAQIVRASLETAGPATAGDLAARIAADCAKVGVAFPASLVSRLKQGGFLREVSE